MGLIRTIRRRLSGGGLVDQIVRSGGSVPDPEPVLEFNPGSLPVGSALYAVPTSGVVWVAKNGSDTSGNGSSGSPYATIKKGLAIATAGQTVVVREGSYYEGGLYPNLGIGPVVGAVNVTLQAAPGEAVWLDGSDAVTGWAADTTSVPGKTVWRAPLVQTINRAPTQVRGETSSDWGNFLVEEFPIAHWPEQCWVDGVLLTQVQTLAEVGPGKFFVEGTLGSGNNFTSSNYVIGSDPSGKEVRIGTRARALGSSKAGFTMRGIGVRRYVPSLCDWGVLYLGGSTSSVTVTGLLVENCVMEDISILALKVEVASATVRYCTFKTIGQEAISSGYADDEIIEHCWFENCNSHVFNYGPDSGAIKNCRCHRVTVRYNRFKDIKTHGYWMDQAGIGGVVHGNLFTDIWGRPVLVEISDSYLVMDNIIVRAGVGSPITRRLPYQGPGVSSSGSDRCWFGYNTIIDSCVDVSWSQDTRTPAVHWGSVGDPRYSAAWAATNCPWEIKKGGWWNNLLVYNTTAYNTTNSVFVSLDQSYGKTDIDGLALRAGGNAYVRRASGIPVRFGLAYPDGAIKVYSTMTSTGGGTYDPTVSWINEFGEVGSALGVNAAPFVSEATYETTAAVRAMVTPQSDPVMEWSPIVADWMPTVDEILDASLFTRQPFGAGHLS